MAQHRRLSSSHKDFSLWDIMEMSLEDIFNFICLIKFGEPNMQICPHCGAVDKNPRIKNGFSWRCKNCFDSFSLTSGTVFDRCRLPLKKFFLMLFLFATNPNGISAVNLSVQTKINYKTSLVFTHKLREVLLKTRPNHKMSGEIHIDGGHFGGKPRDGQFRNKAKPEDIANKIKLGKSQGAKRSRMSRANYERRKRNRRIILVVRKVEPGIGGVDTRVFISDAEREDAIRQIVNECVEPGSLIRTDEDPAYNFLSAKFEHETVCHKTEYSTIDGVSNNHAESMFSRIRRMEYGVTHRMESRYMLSYANEMAWRDDSRFKTEYEKFSDLLKRVFTSELSEWFRGYWQGNKLACELKLSL